MLAQSVGKYAMLGFVGYTGFLNIKMISERRSQLIRDLSKSSDKLQKENNDLQELLAKKVYGDLEQFSDQPETQLAAQRMQTKE